MHDYKSRGVCVSVYKEKAIITELFPKPSGNYFING